MDEADAENPAPSPRAGGTSLSAQRRRYVGSRITRFREHRGLSLEELGQRVGLSAGVLEAVESGKRGVTFECLIDIAIELDVAASDLVEGME
ncbi:helix-turn-helix domain-containing protein [Mycolicibacterium nivoides]|uniref:helix-turn-helix domain-containing protein n=1 Tax=Mycolicibacterium nivoides TaxID=2487344 RepID=UPI003C2F0CB9